MFSARTNWHLQPNNLAQLLAEKKNGGNPILDLTISNPLQAAFAYPVEAIRNVLSKPASISYSPDPIGLLSAREAVAQYYLAKHIVVDPLQIVLTASTSEAYTFLFKLLCNAGDSVLVPAPSYPLFEHLAQLDHVETKAYQLRYDGEWHIDFSSIRNALTSSTKAIIVVSPHNPTGMFLKAEELAMLNSIANNAGIALIIDEVFADYGFDDDARRAESTAANNSSLTFTLNGISKSCGLPQLKLGWIVASGEGASEALQRLEMIADTYLSVNTPVQVALAELLELSATVRAQIQSRTRQHYHFLKQQIDTDSPLSILNAEGGWSAVVRIPNTKSEEEWAIELLRESGVYVHPGYFFEFSTNGYLIVSLLTAPEIFRRGVGEIVKLIR
ncbi:MAG: pyridoxal phosphate-dependent aminotransferase [Ignavibacteriae bacterium]|nr:pyridoxal phosphate-dependent aminotransferase [Ignavibacteriota bacterium]